jgi:hypothetical protein
MWVAAAPLRNIGVNGALIPFERSKSYKPRLAMWGNSNGSRSNRCPRVLVPSSPYEAASAAPPQPAESRTMTNARTDEFIKEQLGGKSHCMNRAMPALANQKKCGRWSNTGLARKNFCANVPNTNKEQKLWDSTK